MTFFETRQTIAAGAAPGLLPRLRVMTALAGLYLVSLGVGFALFILAFKTGLLQAMSVLFFRGILLALVAGVFTFGLVAAGLTRWPRRDLTARDAFAGAVLSLSFNICFLVVVPVTVDRSISVFVLGEMAADPDHLFSPDEMSALFTRVYIGDYRQIDRRLKEQTVTGNVERIGEGYRISSRGRRFIELSQWVNGAFGGDPRLATPPARQPTQDENALPVRAERSISGAGAAISGQRPPGCFACGSP